MLVLRRKADESIVINNVIKITVLSVEGDRVKIGIDAPPDVIIVREELLDGGGSVASRPRQPTSTFEAPRCFKCGAYMNTVTGGCPNGCLRARGSGGDDS